MAQGFDEMMALYKASVRKAPALMMENLQVDANRGVTSRGNSPYDKFSSPETRAKVLESRLQEIEAFARSRSIPASNIYALAEAAMRTGKIPDLGQFGLAGDDAVATKQFLISNVLNIAGLEWVDYKGDPVEEDELDEEAVATSERARQDVEEKRAQEIAARMSEIEGKPVSTDHPTVRELVRRHMADYYSMPGKLAADVVLDPSKAVIEGDEEGEDATQTLRRRRKARKTVGGYEFTEETAPEDNIDKATGALGAKVKAKAGRVIKFPQKAPPEPEPPVTAAKRPQFKLTQVPRAQKLAADYAFDPRRYMAEEGGPYRTGGAPMQAPLSPGRTTGGEVLANPQSYEKYDLLPKEVMSKLRSEIGDDVYSYTREDLFRLARSRGLLGTEEGTGFDPSRYMTEAGLKKLGRRGQLVVGTMTPDQDEDLPHPHTYARSDPYSQLGKIPYRSAQARYRALSGQKRRVARLDGRDAEGVERAREGAARMTQAGNTPPGALRWKKEEDVQFEHDYQGHAKMHGGKFVRYIQGNIGVYDFPSAGAAQKFAEHSTTRTTATPKVDGKRVFIDEPVMGESAHLGYGGNDRSAGSNGLSNSPGPTLSPWEEDEEDEKAKEKSVKEDKRSESDKILGIEAGDPRGESWPKLSPSMAQLLNLESCGVFRGPRGFSMDEPEPEQIDESTVSGGMGGFIGGGMMGGMTGRSVALPSYDASYELPEDPEERVKVLNKMLGKHGLKDVEEDDTQEQFKSPMFRDDRYDDHPSRIMGEASRDEARQSAADVSASSGRPQQVMLRRGHPGEFVRRRVRQGDIDVRTGGPKRGSTELFDRGRLTKRGSSTIISRGGRSNVDPTSFMKRDS